MVKKHNISQIIIKLLLSASIIQLMLICFVLVPPTDASEAFPPELKAYIPEMTEYAAITAALSLPIGIMIEKFIDKTKK